MTIVESTDLEWCPESRGTTEVRQAPSEYEDVVDVVNRILNYDVRTIADSDIAAGHTAVFRNADAFFADLDDDQ